MTARDGGDWAAQATFLADRDGFVDLETQAPVSGDYRVADLSLAPFGRKEIHLAEHEMPGLRALRKEFGPSKPLAGAGQSPAPAVSPTWPGGCTPWSRK